MGFFKDVKDSAKEYKDNAVRDFRETPPQSPKDQRKLAQGKKK